MSNFAVHAKGILDQKLKAKMMGYPIMSWIYTSLSLMALDRKHVEFFAPGEWELIPDLARNKRVLKWTCLGSVIADLVGRGFMHEADLAPKRSTSFLFRHLSPVVMAQFSSDLVELRGIMCAQKDLAEQLRTKAMAASVSAAITIGSFLAQIAAAELEKRM